MKIGFLNGYQIKKIDHKNREEKITPCPITPNLGKSHLKDTLNFVRRMDPYTMKNLLVLLVSVEFIPTCTIVFHQQW